MQNTDQLRTVPAKQRQQAKLNQTTQVIIAKKTTTTTTTKHDGRIL